MTGEQKEMIIQMRKESKGYTAIANVIGIPKETVKTVLPAERHRREQSVLGSSAGSQVLPGVRSEAGAELPDKAATFLLGCLPKGVVESSSEAAAFRES